MRALSSESISRLSHSLPEFRDCGWLYYRALVPTSSPHSQGYRRVLQIFVEWKWKCGHSVGSDPLQSYWLYVATRLLHPWDFPGMNTGVGCHLLLQGIFRTQGLNSRLSHCRQTIWDTRESHLNNHKAHGSDAKESVFNAGGVIQSLGQEYPLEKRMAAHSSILAWEVPWKEEPGGLQSLGLQRDWHSHFQLKLGLLLFQILAAHLNHWGILKTATPEMNQALRYCKNLLRWCCRTSCVRNHWTSSVVLNLECTAAASGRLYLLLCFLFGWVTILGRACGILVPWLEITPIPQPWKQKALTSLNHWTTREVPWRAFKIQLLRPHPQAG